MIRPARDATALLVIDIQERLLPVIAGGSAIVTRTSVAVRGAVELGIPLLATEQYPKGLGSTVAELAGLLEVTGLPDKLSFSACGVEKIDSELARLAPRSVIVAGIETHVCVMQTCLDLLERESTPVVLADCTGSRHEHDHRIALDRLRQAGAIITTVESVLFELTGRAGSDEFKAISKLVKPL